MEVFESPSISQAISTRALSLWPRTRDRKGQRGGRLQASHSSVTLLNPRPLLFTAAEEERGLGAQSARSDDALLWMKETVNADCWENDGRRSEINSGGHFNFCKGFVGHLFTKCRMETERRAEARWKREFSQMQHRWTLHLFNVHLFFDKAHTIQNKMTGL